MIDKIYIREKREILEKALIKRRVSFEIEKLYELDENIRKLKIKIDRKRQERNEITREIGNLKREKKEDKSLQDMMEKAKIIGEEIKVKESVLKEKQEELNKFLLEIPNIPDQSVPIGKSSQDNTVIKEWGEKRNFSFDPKPHWEIGEKLNILDFEKAGEIAGSRFVIYKGYGALLERALLNFFLDIHVKEHGYKEIIPPFLVKDSSAYGSAHLPKFDIEMYKTKDENLYLLPTAEMALANLHRNEILNEEDLPLNYVSWTPCFRREAGSYGKEVRGMIRVHQFNKVELFKFTKPEDSFDELEKMRNDVERILQLLEIPYRVVLLCTADLGFASAKTYDIEAWAPGSRQWLEVSSISNCLDFQAMRTMTRFKRKGSKKNEFVHTLNGSGLALPRTFISIIENYQNKDHSVSIPKVLNNYIHGLEKISKE